MEAIIRRAIREDYAQACRLFDMLDQLHRGRAPGLFQAPESQPRSRDFFDALLSNPDSVLFVAEAGTLVGLAHGVMRAAPDFPVFVRQRWGVIDDVVVDPSWRRRGVGRALTEAVGQWALDQGASWTELNVYAFNDEATAFYRSLGYLPLSTKMRKPRISTRVARADDAAESIQLLRRSFVELGVDGHQNDAATLQAWLQNKTTERFARWLADPDVQVAVAEVDGAIRGVGSVDRSGEIRLCYVLPGFQGIGIGRAVLTHLEAHASKAWQLSSVHLTSGIGARAFYERAGYQSSGLAKPGFGISVLYPYKKLLTRP